MSNGVARMTARRAASIQPTGSQYKNVLVLALVGLRQYASQWPGRMVCSLCGQTGDFPRRADDKRPRQSLGAAYLASQCVLSGHNKQTCPQRQIPKIRVDPPVQDFSRCRCCPRPPGPSIVLPWAADGIEMANASLTTVTGATQQIHAL